MFCPILNAQQPVTDTTFYERFIVEAGVRMPLDKLADKIGPSPEFGIWFRSRMPDNDMIDVGFTLYTPTNRREFDYTDNKAVYTVKPDAVSGMAGVRFNKLYALSGTRFKKLIEWSTTAGYAFFMYTDKGFKPVVDTRSSSPATSKAFSTFHIGQGLKLNVNNVCLQVHYNYTPYGLLSDHVGNNFGSHSLTFGIFYTQ